MYLWLPCLEKYAFTFIFSRSLPLYMPCCVWLKSKVFKMSKCQAVKIHPGKAFTFQDLVFISMFLPMVTQARQSYSLCSGARTEQGERVVLTPLGAFRWGASFGSFRLIVLLHPSNSRWPKLLCALLYVSLSGICSVTGGWNAATDICFGLRGKRKDRAVEFSSETVLSSGVSLSSPSNSHL